MSPRPYRQCLGCGHLTPRSRCRACEAKQNQAYNHGHRIARREVLERDGHACQCDGCAICSGHPCQRFAITADHITPLAQGGTTHAGNLRAMCRPCNSSKRDRTT